MALADQRNRDQSMAAHLMKMGYFHGRRMTSGHCPICYGSNHGGVCNVVGSTKYRRLMERQRPSQVTPRRAA